ncbi:hypothetical protein GCM10009530_69250 [Microbispora corallina]|uniref:Uncharacterized protein n=1 Tax=Microbispora corallina TaxID=83302 RepID=A0ABQ4FSM1_9ACTN|nr:hypothetical protein Mco01_08240 [Microbispora corallina]
MGSAAARARTASAAATACSTWSGVGTEWTPATRPSRGLVTVCSASPVAGRPASQKGRGSEVRLTSMSLTLCQRVAPGATPPSTIGPERHATVDKFVMSQMRGNFGMFSVSQRFESRATWLSHHPGLSRDPNMGRARR